MKNEIDAGWEIPQYEQVSLSPRSTKYCVVIPVLNEGRRIQDQLSQMNRIKIHESADVIIADGGSSDGSLAEDFLKSVNVRALLIKTGPGRLSAQLRMGYAWALSEGYEGIITIDGNGKDSIESIFDFIAALDEGYDYVQASRFIEGGKGINTPLSRLLAIRLIHAPVISLAAGQWFTDTTQGFRAYSAKYLLHPQVQPFRDVFVQYELLAYLSVRAGRLGLRAKEIPTTRTYPDKGKIPTKISGFAGNFDLLKTLAKLLLGAYNPPRQ